MNTLDAPWEGLASLPRGLWRPGVVTSAGRPAARLAHGRRWLDALVDGVLPPPEAHFGDAQASAPLRAVVADLRLPALARGTPALAEQVLRSLLYSLDRIVDHQPLLDREQAIGRVADEFRQVWQFESQGLEPSLALLRTLGDGADLAWDSLQGQLRSRPWQAARDAAARLARLPALVDLIRRLGRAEREGTAPPAPPPLPPKPGPCRLPLRALHTRLPDAPGEITGVRFSRQIEHLLASEALMLRHPVLKKLWRARHAEGRLLAWQTEAELIDWRADALAEVSTATAPPQPEPMQRGPILLCLDTSGSMRGAPEAIAKAVVIAALQVAHAAGRGCRLIAFGGPGEVLEQDLGTDAEGLQSLLTLMGQSFDGGTDIQAPIEAALAALHRARWRNADLLLVSDGEFGCTPQTLASLEQARAQFGLRVQGVLVGDRETLGLLETCDHIHWQRDWRCFAQDGSGAPAFSPVHSRSLTTLYFPNALSPRAARHHDGSHR